MEYIIIGICVVVVAAICVTVFLKKKTAKASELATVVANTTKSEVFTTQEDGSPEFVIQMEMLPAEAIADESKLVKITDSKVLAHVNNLIPELAQAGNAANSNV